MKERHRLSMLSSSPQTAPRLVVGSDDQSARIWDLATGRVIRHLQGHSGAVHAVAFSRDGKRALTGSWDNTARLWDVATGKELRTFQEHTAGIYAVAFSSNGREVLTGSWDSNPRLRNSTTGETRLQWKPLEMLYSVEMSPDGKRLVTGGTGRVASVWDVTTGKFLRDIKADFGGRIYSAAFLPDGKKLLVGGGDLTDGGENPARLFDIESGMELRQFAPHKGAVYKMTISPDGRRLVTVDKDYSPRLWDTGSGQEMHRFTGHRGVVNAVAFSPDGKRLATGSQDGTVRLWDVASGKELVQATIRNKSWSSRPLMGGLMQMNWTKWPAPTG